MSNGYKARFLEWLRSQPNGATTDEIRANYPGVVSRNLLRPMEQEDKVIFHFDGRWHWAAPKEQLA